MALDQLYQQMPNTFLDTRDRLAKMYDQTEQADLAQLRGWRENELAQAQQPQKLVEAQIGYETAQDNLAALPQELNTKQIGRDVNERVETLRRLHGTLLDPTMDQDTKEMFIDGHVDLLKKTKLAEAVGKEGLPNSPVSLSVAIKKRDIESNYEKLRKALKGNNPEAIQQLRAAIEGYGFDPKQANAIAQQREKDVGDVIKADRHWGPYPPIDRSGSGSEMKEAESIRKYIADETRRRMSDANLQAKVNALGFLLDSAGQLQPAPGKAPSPEHRSMAERLVQSTRSDIDNSTRNARIKYYQLTGIKPDETVGTTPTASASPAPSNVIRYDSKGNRIQ